MAGAVKQIFIADDHEAIRRGVRQVIERDDRVVVGEAADGAQALAALLALKPHLAVLDQSLPSLTGLQVVAKARAELPNCAFLIYTMHDRDSIHAEAKIVGAHGVLLKSEPAEKLREAVETLLVGRTYFPDDPSGTSANPRLTPKRGGPSITAREAEVLKLIAEGFTNRQTAAKLGISVKTVETHRTALQHKTGASNTADLVRFAIRNGLTEA